MAGYGSDAGLSAWLAANGHSLPVGAPTLAVLRERGSAYIDGLYGARFIGLPTSGFQQERAWPRSGASAFGQDIGAYAIPAAVVNASYAAAWQEASAPGSLSVVGSAAASIKRERVDGAVEVEYQALTNWSAEAMAPVNTYIEGLLAPFVRPAAGHPVTRVV